MVLGLSLGVFLLAPKSSELEANAWLYRLGRYGFCFLLGAFAYHLRDLIPVSPTLLPLPAILTLAAEVHG